MVWAKMVSNSRTGEEFARPLARIKIQHVCTDTTSSVRHPLSHINRLSLLPGPKQ